MTSPATTTVATGADLPRTIEKLRTAGFVALTGAGMSTDSGIPDYRGEGSRRTGPVTPMTYQDFLSGPQAQQRYWARSFLGWSRMGGAAPNAGHHALARLEADGLCTGTITQNVDGLHEQAGSNRLVALHGRIATVLCLDCGDRSSRTALQHRLHAVNPGWLEEHTAAPVRPDGDVEIEDTAGFDVPRCESCAGVLKPDVVFFGENVPRDRVQRCYDMVDEACDRGSALLVLGSSLTVMSGLRFVRHAVKRGMYVAIVNRGATRGDPLVPVTLHQGTSEFLTDPLWYH